MAPSEPRVAAAPLLLTTKLHPPPRRDHTITRQRLLERLRASPGTKLTVVAAPAGCGKSTLLGAWRELETAARPVAWLTLDEGDDDPVVLWSYVVETLRRACPDVGASLSAEHVGAGRIASFLLPQLVNDLSEQGGVSLILDDFHRLSRGPARDSLAWLVEHAPSTFRLIVASRSEPAFPLAAMRAHGELLEVRAADLGFTPEEAEALLNGRLALGLAHDDVDDLVERTEGWAAGLYLAALSLQAVEDRHAFVGTFSVRSRAVVDFLIEEVLEAHDASTQELLLGCSILGRLCGPLCDAVLGEEGTGGRLAALARTNLFLVPLDDVGRWYRFHHLFARLLRVELEHRDPGRAPELHRRAYAWHRDNGSVDEAVEHALEAGLHAEAGELIAAVWIDYANVCRHATVLDWLERLPRDVLREDPELLVVAAWVFSLCGRRGERDEAIAAFERLGRLDAGPLPDGFSSVEASLATLRAMIPWGDFGSALENARRAVELEAPPSRWRPVVCTALGWCLYNSGQLDEADRWLAEAVERAPACGQWVVAVEALTQRSLIAGDRGLADRQRTLAEEAMKVTRQRGLEELAGSAYVALGASSAARGECEEALALLERGAVLQRATGHPAPLAHALIRQAALLQAVGRSDDAAAVLDEARATVDACPDSPLLTERLAALERTPRRQRRESRVLSSRELAILRMLGGTLSERDIGRELYLSHNTIHSHTRSIYRKLGVSSRSEALAHAREAGLL